MMNKEESPLECEEIEELFSGLSDGFPKVSKNDKGSDLHHNMASGAALGLDVSTSTEWIYPTNYPIRDYQKNIVSKALFQNTLVSLPTGLGKTFIAAVVMYNFNRWFPNHKVLFMAHSKPLVAQQIEACCRIMGIPQNVTAHLTGNMAPSTRKQHWSTKRIFFLTPQVFNNDLNRGLVCPKSIRCVVIDEAHKALGNQAFCQVIRSIHPFNTQFRILALSATPGDDIPSVKSVVENLLISHLELRTDDDLDIKKYLHEKKVEAVVVGLDGKIIEYKNQLLKVAEKYLLQLVQMKAISGSFGSLSSFLLVQKQKQFIANPSVGTGQRGFVLSNFCIVISIFKALEELIVHGLRSFHNKLLSMKSGEGAKNNIHHRLAKDQDFLALIDTLHEYIGEDKDLAFDPDVSMARLQDALDAQVVGESTPLVYSHPKFVKLEEIITQHFNEWMEKGVSTRVIVFCRSRPCTGEICNFLNRFRPLVKPMVLIGQSHTGSGSTSRGLKQSAQLEVMRKFRAGEYNTLVATCVGEEGLDVGEVDLIVNFDARRNSNTQVQRSGRTGRKRDGRVVTLVTEGKEYQDYNLSIVKSKNITKKLCSGIKNLPLYPNSPRLLPIEIQPVCQEMYLKESKQKGSSEDQRVRSKKKPTLERSIRNKPPRVETERDKTKIKIGKSNKKGGYNNSVLSQGTNAKYDIRYAMSKAQEKTNIPFVSDDTSDSQFESVGAVALYRDLTAKTKKLQDIPKTCGTGKNTEIVCLGGSIEGGSNTDHSTMPMKVGQKALQEMLKKPLDASLCDVLDTLSMIELVSFAFDNSELIRLPHHYSEFQLRKLQELSPSSDTEGSSSEFVMNEIPLPIPPDARKDFHSLLVDDCDDILMDVDIEENNDPATGAPETKFPRKMSGSRNAHVNTPIRQDLEVEKECPLLKTFGESTKLVLQDSFDPVGNISSVKVTLNQCIASPNNRDISMVTVTQAIGMIASYQRNKPNEHGALDLQIDKAETIPEGSLVTGKTKSQVVLEDKILIENGCGIEDFSRGSVCARLPSSFCYTGLQSDSPATLTNTSQTMNSVPCQQKTPSSPHQSLYQPYSAHHFNDLLTPSPKQSLGIGDVSPSLVSNSAFSKRLSSKVKKSLLFNDAPQVPPTPCKTDVNTDLDSDEDLFAEEEKIRCTQNKKEMDTIQLNSSPLTQAYNIVDLSPPHLSFTNHDSDLKKKPVTRCQEWPPPRQQEKLPKTAVVRPLGFEKFDSNVSEVIRDRSVDKQGVSSRGDSGWLTTANKPRPPTILSLTKMKTKYVRKDQRTLNSFFTPEKRTRTVSPSAGNMRSNSSHPVQLRAGSSTSNFDCMPDDLAELLGASPTESKTHNTPLQRRQPLIRHSTPLFGSSTTFETDKEVAEGELSDGALEAIQAVKEYEKAVKSGDKTTSKSEPVVFDLWSSGSSDDFFEKPPTGQTRKVRKRRVLSLKSKEKRKRKNRCQRRKKDHPFIEVEAELSGNMLAASSDDEDTSGLDDMDSSFLDERTALTQAPGVDMTARYLAAVKSPRVVSGAFNIPDQIQKDDSSVFSQVPLQDEDYCHDSFCVAEVTDSVVGELSELELAELALEKKKKRRRNDSPVLSAPCGGKKKRRRIITAASSSDDELLVDWVVPRPKSPSRSTLPVVTVKSTEIMEVRPGQIVIPCNDVSVAFSSENRPKAPTRVLIGSRQIASAPEIITTLRAKFKLHLDVRSCPGADFIVSWRLGINRVTLSDFCSGAQPIKTALRESVLKLVSLFLKPVLIVEDDKKKSVPRTAGCHRDMWMQHSAKRLARLHHADVAVLFTRSKDDTAQTIAHIAQSECQKGHGVVTEWTEIPPQLETKLKFYTSLPGVNTAMAMRLCRKFSTLSSFISICDSLPSIRREVGVPQATAALIYNVLFSPPRS